MVIFLQLHGQITKVKVEKCKAEEGGKIQVDQLEGQLSLAQEEVERTVSKVNEIGKELTTYKKSSWFEK